MWSIKIIIIINIVLVKALDNITTILMDPADQEYKSFEIFKYFVFPAKNQKKTMVGNKSTRNITLKELQPKQIDAKMSRQYDYPIMAHQTPPGPAAAPHHFYPNNGMTHLADPLFLMATLAFVTFLINSVLGLVDRINVPPVVRARDIDDSFLIHAQTNHLNEELLYKIQAVLEEFENSLVAKGF